MTTWSAVRWQALTAKGDEEEVPIAQQLREPKLAEQMLEHRVWHMRPASGSLKGRRIVRQG